MPFGLGDGELSAHIDLQERRQQKIKHLRSAQLPPRPVVYYSSLPQRGSSRSSSPPRYTAVYDAANGYRSVASNNTTMNRRVRDQPPPPPYSELALPPLSSSDLRARPNQQRRKCPESTPRRTPTPYTDPPTRNPRRAAEHQRPEHYPRIPAFYQSLSDSKPRILKGTDLDANAPNARTRTPRAKSGATSNISKMLAGFDFLNIDTGPRDGRAVCLSDACLFS